MLKEVGLVFQHVGRLAGCDRPCQSRCCCFDRLPRMILPRMHASVGKRGKKDQRGVFDIDGIDLIVLVGRKNTKA